MATGLLGHGTRKIGLARSGCTMDQQILCVADPVTARETRQLTAIESSSVAVIDVFEAGGAFFELSQL